MKGRLVRVLLSAVLVIPALISTKALAAEKEENKFLAVKKVDTEFHGDITAIGTNATITVKAKEKGGTMTFSIPGSTLFFVKHKNSGASLSDFKVGEEVNVLYHQSDSAIVADSVWQPGSSPRDKEHKAEKKQ